MPGSVPQAIRRALGNFAVSTVEVIVIRGSCPCHTREAPEDPASCSILIRLLWATGSRREAEEQYGLALRRLQGRVRGFDGSDGVGVLMRYTLRLLTIQQFQRATALICACESIRRKALEQSDKRWGETPFRIGLWVGQRATPNSTADAQQAIQNARGNQWRQLGTGTPAQLSSCPWCGSEIQPGRDVVVKTSPNYFGRTFTFCSDALGRCDFTPSKAPETKQKAGAALARRDAWMFRHADEGIAVWDGVDPAVGKAVRSLQDHVGEDEVWLLEP